MIVFIPIVVVLEGKHAELEQHGNKPKAMELSEWTLCVSNGPSLWVTNILVSTTGPRSHVFMQTRES